MNGVIVLTPIDGLKNGELGLFHPYKWSHGTLLGGSSQLVSG